MGECTQTNGKRTGNRFEIQIKLEEEIQQDIEGIWNATSTKKNTADKKLSR